MESAHPTELEIERRLAFHESGAAYYDQHGSPSMANWSRAQAELWRNKLEKDFPK